MSQMSMDMDILVKDGRLYHVSCRDKTTVSHFKCIFMFLFLKNCVASFSYENGGPQTYQMAARFLNTKKYM